MTKSGLANLNQNRGQCVEDGLVADTQHTIGRRDQKYLALGIVGTLLVMNTAVDFDDEAPFGTAEVRHEGTNRMLAAELQTRKSTTPNGVPKQRFGRCLLCAEVPRSGNIEAMASLRSSHGKTSVHFASAARRRGEKAPLSPQ